MAVLRRRLRSGQSAVGPDLPGKVMHPNPQPTRVRLLWDRSAGDAGERCVLGLRHMRMARLAGPALLLAALLLPVRPAWAGQTESPKPEPTPTEAPRPRAAAHGAAPEAGPCQLRRAGAALAGTAAAAAAAASGAANAALGVNSQPGAQQVPCPPLLPFINWYERFTNGPQVKPMTPKEKRWLAVRNVVDPFNAVTILGDAAIAVGYNAHSPYGPGMTGFGRYVGVSYSQDMTGEFFGTFLIPTIVHQDPHYHRMPNATIRRRIAHAILQVVWTQGDNGKEMVNYADLAGFAIDDEIGNLYVPGQKTNLPASAARYSIGLASAPIENFITEFMPDVARRIHVRVILFQRIFNQVARTGAPGSP